MNAKQTRLLACSERNNLGGALKAFLPEETRSSIHRAFQALKQLLQLGDGQGFGFFLPEQQSGIEINPDQRRQVARWFESGALHDLV